MLFFSIFLLIAAVWLVAGCYKFFKRKLVIILIFAAICICGVLAYFHIDSLYIDGGDIPDRAARMLSPLNNTISIFFPSRGDATFGQNGVGSWYYQIIQILAYFFAAIFVLSFFGRQIFHSMIVRLAGRRLIEIKDIFWGFSEQSLAVARIMAKRNPGRIVIFALPKSMEYDKDSFKKIFKRIDAAGCFVFTYDDSGPEKYLECALCAYNHYFMTEDQGQNVSLSLNVANVAGPILNASKKAKKHEKPASKINIYLRSELENISFYYNKENIQLHIANYSECVARKFVQDYPVFDALAQKGAKIDEKKCEINDVEYKVLVLGMGWVGLQIVKRIFCDAQFRGNFKISITVIDRDFDSSRGWLASVFSNEGYYNEEFNKDYNIEINPEFNGERVKNVESSLFYEWLDERIGKDRHARILDFDRIIVALGDDSYNMEQAMHLQNFNIHRMPPGKDPGHIFVNLNDKSHLKGYSDFIKPFGDIDSYVAMMLDEKGEFIAKLVNYAYSKSKQELAEEDFIKACQGGVEAEIEKEWPIHSYFNQQSSYAVALNIANVFKITGCIDRTGKFDTKKFKEKVSKPEYLEYLAEMEHLRWNAFHFVNGVFLYHEGDHKTEEKVRFYDNAITVRHSCLMPFNKLGKDTKEIDRKIVRYFATMMEIADEKFPNKIEMIKFKVLVDLHTHTVVSGHAYSTLQEMARAAADKGVEILGITEHAPSIPGTCNYLYFKNLIVVPRKMYGVRLLLGAEINILDAEGNLDMPEDIMQNRLDLRIAGIHSLCWKPGTKEENTQGVLKVMRNPYIHIIAHPGDGAAELDFEPLVEESLRSHTLLEINSHSMHPERHISVARDNNLEILRLCKKHRVPIILGSDAHISASIGCYDYALPLLEEADFPMELVLNDKPKELLSWLGIS